MSELSGSDRDDWLLQPLRRVRDFGKVPIRTQAEEDEEDAKPKKVTAAQGMSCLVWGGARGAMCYMICYCFSAMQHVKRYAY